MIGLVTPGRFASPGVDPRWPAAKRERADRLERIAAAAAPHLALPGHADADVEDFFEYAARIEAAVLAFDECWIAIDRQPETIARRVADGTELPVGSLSRFGAVYGPLSRAETGHHGGALDERGVELLREHGRRRVMLGTIDTEAPSAGEAVGTFLAELAAAGAPHAVVKVNHDKAGMWVVPTSTEPERNERAVLDAAGWTGVRLDGVRHAWLVQAHVEMRHEYRFFAVDGTLVTGAGCIEERTPLDHDPDDGPFDPWTRERRGNGIQSSTSSAPSRRPDVVERMMPLAAVIAAEIGEATSFDLALGADDEPLLVEVNGLSNAGLYASEPALVTRALAR